MVFEPIISRFAPHSSFAPMFGPKVTKYLVQRWFIFFFIWISQSNLIKLIFWFGKRKCFQIIVLGLEKYINASYFVHALIMFGTYGVNLDLEVRTRRNEIVKSWLYDSIGASVLSHLPCTMWSAIDKKFSSSSHAQIMDIRFQL